MISDRLAAITPEPGATSAALASISDRANAFSSQPRAISVDPGATSDHASAISAQPACDSAMSLDILDPPTRVVPEGVRHVFVRAPMDPELLGEFRKGTESTGGMKAQVPAVRFRPSGRNASSSVIG